MSLKKTVVTISILSIAAIALFVYPLMNQSVRAEQVNFTGNRNQNISFQKAAEVLKTAERIVASDAVLAQYFGKDIVDKILAQPGCVRVRMYYGKHADGKLGVLLLGVDQYGRDMVTGVLAMPTYMCPPLCHD